VLDHTRSQWLNMKLSRACLVVHAFDPSTQEVEAGRLRVPGQLRLQGETGLKITTAN
jgi:hypothetical protein